MVFHQISRFAQPTPHAVQDVVGTLVTLTGLTREGKTDSRGLPKNPLQMAATLKVLSKYEGYDTSLPIPVQRFLAATVGNLAEALGYRAVYPRYLLIE